MRLIGPNGICSNTLTESLTEILLPDGAEGIGEQCFPGCHRLSRVTFGKSTSLKPIGARSFAQSALSSFSLPASVDSIGGVFRESSE